MLWPNESKLHIISEPLVPHLPEKIQKIHKRLYIYQNSCTSNQISQMFQLESSNRFENLKVML